MHDWIELWHLLMWPFFICLLMTGLHVYMGMHVLRRGVIFVDLALAQMAALGATVALLASPYFIHDVHSSVTSDDFAQQVEALEHAQAKGMTPEQVEQQQQAEHDREQDRLVYIFSLGFAVIGAALIGVSRFRDDSVPHEAIIGIFYVVSAALAVMVLSKSVHGKDEIEAMLVGNILFQNQSDVIRTFFLYFGIGVIHFLFRRQFLQISESAHNPEATGLKVIGWDFLFYLTFALMVTESVRMAGVLVVFSFLIIPAAAASMVMKGFMKQLVLAWGIAIAASVMGLYISAARDYPTGPSLVSSFGMMLVLFVIVRWILMRTGHVSAAKMGQS